jgi:hypothetical protein
VRVWDLHPGNMNSVYHTELGVAAEPVRASFVIRHSRFAIPRLIGLTSKTRCINSMPEVAESLSFILAPCVCVIACKVVERDRIATGYVFDGSAVRGEIPFSDVIPAACPFRAREEAALMGFLQLLRPLTPVYHSGRGHHSLMPPFRSLLPMWYP